MASIFFYISYFSVRIAITIAIYYADKLESLYLFVFLIGFFVLLMTVDTGPFESGVDNLMHVYNNAIYIFVLIIITFLKAKQYFSPYQ